MIAVKCRRKLNITPDVSPVLSSCEVLWESKGSVGTATRKFGMNNFKTWKIGKCTVDRNGKIDKAARHAHK